MAAFLAVSWVYSLSVLLGQPKVVLLPSPEQVRDSKLEQSKKNRLLDLLSLAGTYGEGRDSIVFLTANYCTACLNQYEMLIQSDDWAGKGILLVSLDGSEKLFTKTRKRYESMYIASGGRLEQIRSVYVGSFLLPYLLQFTPEKQVSIPGTIVNHQGNLFYHYNLR
jgi:hypothetical protein